MIILLYIAVIAFFLLLAFSFQSQEPMRVVERLQKVQNAAAQNKLGGLRDQEVMQKSLAVRVLLPLADKFSKLFATVTPVGMLDQCRKDIAKAGMTGKVTPTQITTLSWIFLIGLPIFFFFLTLSKPKDQMTWGLIAISGILGYRMPLGIIQSKGSKRQSEIQKALPFTFDLVSIGVESGVSFDGAIALVAEKTTGPLTDELNLTLNEIRLGKSRNDALKDLSERIGLDDLRNFLTAVSYISKMGGSLVEVIRVQTDTLRTKRRQRAEEKAMKTPVKIMIPLVLFIFPAMFIVILGPAAVQMSKGNF